MLCMSEGEFRTVCSDYRIDRELVDEMLQVRDGMNGIFAMKDSELKLAFG